MSQENMPMKNEENRFLHIFLQVKNKIDLFEQEFQLVSEGFEKMKKIHRDITLDFQGLGDFSWLLSSKNKSQESLNKMSDDDDDDSDEVVPRSPIKKKKKLSEKNSLMIKFNSNGKILPLSPVKNQPKLPLKKHIVTQMDLKIANNQETQIKKEGHVDDENSTNIENKFVKISVVDNDDFDETYCPWAEDQLKKKNNNILYWDKQTEHIPENNIKIETGNKKAVVDYSNESNNLSLDKYPLQSLASSLKNNFNSYDCFPERKKKSPQYAYKGPVVRKKLERAKLTGWDCEKCEKWYRNLGLSSTELQKRKNSTSRHRSKFNERYETPPGFWNLSFPKTFSSSDED